MRSDVVIEENSGIPWKWSPLKHICSLYANTAICSLTLGANLQIGWVGGMLHARSYQLFVLPEVSQRAKQTRNGVLQSLGSTEYGCTCRHSAESVLPLPSSPNLIAPFTVRNPPMWVDPTLHSTICSTNERTCRFHKKKLPALSSFQRYTCPFSDIGTSFWYSSASSCSSPNQSLVLFLSWHVCQLLQ